MGTRTDKADCNLGLILATIFFITLAILVVGAGDVEGENKAPEVHVNIVFGEGDNLMLDGGENVSVFYGDWIKLIGEAQDPEADAIRYEWTFDVLPPGPTMGSWQEGSLLQFFVGQDHLFSEVDGSEPVMPAPGLISGLGRCM